MLPLFHDDDDDDDDDDNDGGNGMTVTMMTMVSDATLAIKIATVALIRVNANFEPRCGVMQICL